VKKTSKNKWTAVRYVDTTCLSWKPLTTKVNSYKEHTAINKNNENKERRKNKLDKRFY